MADHVKSFIGLWRHGHGDQIFCSFAKVGRVLLKGLVSTTTFIFFTFIILIAAWAANWMDINIIQGNPILQMISPFRTNSRKHHERIEFPLHCSYPNLGLGQKCPDNYPSSFEPDEDESSKSNVSCPDYFRWIHQDLKQWESSGITQEMIERGKPYANFRLVIVAGKAYVEKYSKPYQTRDVFSIWGILQLLRLYPGMVPDLDIMFYSGDKTLVMKKYYQTPNASLLPPVFHYCGQEESIDIVFPDWTFWGWAEVNIMPWEDMLSAIKKGSKRTKWIDREPYAYWKGNPYVCSERHDLMKCNLPNVRLYNQDWNKESKEGFKHSKLEDQCSYRYKIYIEGQTWSVSEKYILACDSMTLMVTPKYYDFFSRSMVPLKHYWPIRPKNKCRDLKFAVEWGNNNTDMAEAIGKAGSKLMEEYLAMQNVYDYMFHLLNQYAELLKFKPTIPPKAKRICSETMACSDKGLFRKFKEQSMVKSPSNKLPCTMPPPYDPQEIQASLDTKQKIIRQVETWEAEYWKKQNDKKQQR